VIVDGATAASARSPLRRWPGWAITFVALTEGSESDWLKKLGAKEVKLRCQH